MVSGDLSIAGTTLRAGDYIRIQEGAEHGVPVTPSGCVCIVISNYVPFPMRSLLGFVWTAVKRWWGGERSSAWEGEEKSCVLGPGSWVGRSGRRLVIGRQQQTTQDHRSSIAYPPPSSRFMFHRDVHPAPCREIEVRARVRRIQQIAGRPRHATARTASA